MKLEEMRQEVISRGYDYVKPVSRIDGYLNRAYQQIVARHEWPFIETTVEGEAPLEIVDLRKVKSVRNVTQGTLLRGVTYNMLVSSYPEMNGNGPAEYWWLDGNTIRVFPESETTIEVRYTKVPIDLGDQDEPIIPSRWQYLIVDRAIVDCLRDDDEYEQARFLMQEVTEGVRQMVGDLMHRNLQEARTVIRTGQPGDYL